MAASFSTAQSQGTRCYTGCSKATSGLKLIFVAKKKKKTLAFSNLMLGICKRFYAFEEAQDLFNSISGYSVQACRNGRCVESGLTRVWLLGGRFGLVWMGQIEGCLPVRAESFARLSAPNRSARLTLLTGGSNRSIAALIQLDHHQPTHAETLIGNSCSTRKRCQIYSQTPQTRQL